MCRCGDITSCFVSQPLSSTRTTWRSRRSRLAWTTSTASTEADVSQVRVSRLSTTERINQSINQSINRSINQSISQSISQSIDRSIDRSIDWAIDRWAAGSLLHQIFVMCFKDLSRFKYKVGCRFRFLEDWTETTWVQASEVLSHPELDSTERSASGEALEEFLSMEEESTAVNHIWLTNSPTFLLWIWISEMFYIRTQKTETFFFFDHDQEGKSWTYRAICFDRTKLKITREQKLKTRAEESLVKCEVGRQSVFLRDAFWVF